MYDFVNIIEENSSQIIFNVKHVENHSQCQLTNVLYTLNEQTAYCGFHYGLHHDNPQFNNILTIDGLRILHQLMALPGIVNIEFNDGYKVVVTKAITFHWDEIKRFLFHALNDNFVSLSNYRKTIRTSSISEHHRYHRIFTHTSDDNELVISFRILLCQKGKLVTLFDRDNIQYADNIRLYNFVTRRGKKIFKHLTSSFLINAINKITVSDYSMDIVFNDYRTDNNNTILNAWFESWVTGL